MARPNSIPDSLLPAIIKMFDNGANAQKVSEWLKQEHDITASVWTVNHRVQELKKLEQEAKKTAIAEAASKSALDCVSMLDTQILEFHKQAIDLVKSEDLDTKALGKSFAETLLKYINTKMNLTGMDKQEMSKSEEDLIEDLLNRFGK